jgi:hypothetical protein
MYAAHNVEWTNAIEIIDCRKHRIPVFLSVRDYRGKEYRLM